MPTKRKASVTKKKPVKIVRRNSKSRKVSDREFLETLIKFTKLGIEGLGNNENGWLNYQLKSLNKRLKSLK